jgi:hypothetical protein
VSIKHLVIASLIKILLSVELQTERLLKLKTVSFCFIMPFVFFFVYFSIFTIGTESFIDFLLFDSVNR